MGQRHHAFIDSISKDREIIESVDVCEATSGNKLSQNVHCSSLDIGGKVAPNTDAYDEDIVMNQKEDSIELEYSSGLTEEQLVELEAYSMLFALGGYTYNNTVQEEETTNEVGNRVESGGKEEANDDADGDDDSSSPEVDEESLINQKSAYEQKFIRAYRSVL